MSKERLRVAVVGAGVRAEAHLVAIDAMEDRFELAAVCDLDEAAARGAAERHRCRAYGDVRTLLDREAIALADIVTSPASHHALSAFFARHSVHVLCETPIAVSIPLADLAIEAAEASGVVLAVAENAHLDPLVQLWRDAIAAGLIGELVRVQSLGLQNAYHATALLRALAGSTPARVRARAGSVRIDPLRDARGRPHERERWLSGLLEYAGGVVGVLDQTELTQVALLGRRRGAMLRVEGTRGTIVQDALISAAGTLQVRELHDGAAPEAPLLGLALESEGQAPVLSWRNPHPGAVEVGLADALLDTAKAIAERRPPKYGAAEARLDHACYLALEESAARGGMPLELPLQHPTSYERTLHDDLRSRYGVDPGELDALLEAL